MSVQVEIEEIKAKIKLIVTISDEVREALKRLETSDHPEGQTLTITMSDGSCHIRGGRYASSVGLVYDTMRIVGQPVAPSVIGNRIGDEAMPQVHNRVRQILHRHQGKLFERTGRGRWSVIVDP